MRQSQNAFGKDFGLVGKNVRRYLATTALTASGFLALVSPALADNWTDHTGTGITVDTSVPNTTNITQSLDIVKVSGDGDINAGWTVNVAQPSSSSKYVLYDIEGDPVNIMGNLNANGQIYIFDQNGVIFGAGSQVNVGSIVASTGMISDANLADNKMVFENVGGNGQIALNGTINVAQAGLAAFVAPTIINNGIINAKLGTVAMASGEKVTLDLYGDNLVEITVDGALENSLIENKGTIRAEGGTIAITAAAAKDAVDNVINMEGVTDVSSVTVKGGKIILGGGSKGTVKVAGKLDASGTTGGEIKVTGYDIEASENAELNADATLNGNGGNVTVLAINNTWYRGRATARGGLNGGNGGFVELSANNELAYDGSVSTLAYNGVSGSFLLDPLYAFIHSGSLNSSNPTNRFISANSLANDLRTNANVTVQATNHIDVGVNTPATNVGTGTVDVSTATTVVQGPFIDYLPTDSNGNLIPVTNPNYSGRYNSCNSGSPGANCVPNYGPGGTSTDITNGNLILESMLVNFNKDLIMGSGNLTVNAARMNLNSQIFGRSSVGGAATLLGDTRLIGAAQLGTINVVSPLATINQALHFSDDATNLTIINVAPGTYVETATNRTLPWSPGATYNMGLLVEKDNVTIRGVDALGNVITDPNNVLATIEAGDITNFGAMHGVVGNGVTFAGLKFTPKVGVRNKTIEVWGNNFTLKNSVVDNSNTATNPTGFSGLYENYGGGAVYIGDERYDAVTNTSSIRRFNLDGNIFIAGSVAITNGVGVVNNASGGAQRNITNNTFVGNGMDPTRADVVYNSGILLTGRQPTIAWRQNLIGAVNISGNTFDGTSAHVLARGEMLGSLDWNQIFTGNTFDKSAAAFESETLVRGEDYVVNGDPRSDWRAIYNTIQWAVDGADSGDTVRVGEGTYAESVNVNKSLTLLGANAGLAGYDVLRDNESIVDPNSPAFNVTANNVTIDGFEITGADTGILVSNASGVKIVNNNIHDVLESGVAFTNSASGEISNNLIHDTVQEGVLATLSNSLQIVGNLIYNTGKDGIAVFNSTNARIASNVLGFTDFLGTTEGDENNINGDGIYAENTDGADEGNTIIVGNKITQTHSTVDGKGSGINVVNSEYVLIGGYSPEEKNTVTKARWDGIRTVTNGGVSQVITIAGNSVDQIDRVGIYAANTSSLLIDNNDVTNSTSQIGVPYGGISTDWGSFITVSGNRVSSSGQGVRMYNAGGSNFISGNDINDVTDNGVHVYDMLDGSNTDITGNYIGYGPDRSFGTEDDTTIGARGIYTLNAKDVLISGNSIGNTGGEGVWAESSTTLDVTGNFVDNTGKAGVHLVIATGPVDISGNQIGQGLNSTINGNGIYLTGMGGTENAVLVQRNKISNTTGDDANGIFAETVTGAMIGGETDEDANILNNISWDGIKVYYGGENTIQRNNVSETGRASIYAGKTKGVKILNNTVHDSDVFWIPEFAYGAITVTESSDTQIDQNIVTGGDESLAQTGIWSTDNTGFNSIFDNNVSDINGTGIFARNVNNLTINENDVYNVDGHGIHAVNIIDGLTINHNIIGGNGVQNRVYGNGIFVEDTDLVGRRGPMGLIQGNDIRNTRSEENNDSNGIFVKNSHGFVIGGIDFEQPPEDDDRDEQQYDRRALVPVLSTANVIRNTGWDGIRIRGGSDHIVIGNDVKNTARAGIFAKNVRRIAILDNTIVDSNWAHGGALAVEGGRHVIVAGNTITSLEDSKAGSGIYMQGTQGLTLIAKNTVSDINGNDNRPGHGIYVDNVRTPRIIGNTVTNVYGDGIYVSGASVARIRRNEVTDARLAGLHIAGPENEYVIVAGNVFTGNDIGAFFESGLIDLTRKGNEFIGGRVGIRFAPYFASNDGEEGGGDEGGFEEMPYFAKIRLSNLSLVDDDDVGSDPYVPGTVPTNYGGTLGAQIFKDQSEYYVELDKGAFFQPGMPTVLNATRSTFINTAQGFEITPEDFAGSLLPAGQIAFLESMFYHYPDGQAAEDFQNLGVFFFGNALPVSAASTTNIDPRLIFTQFPFFNGDLTGLNVQIRGLPNLPGQGGGGNSPASFNNIQTFAGNPSDLNDIETAAGGDDEQDGQNLNEIETQAGGEDESCWNTAANAAGQGQVVNVVYQGSFLDNMEASSSCSGE